MSTLSSCFGKEKEIGVSDICSRTCSHLWSLVWNLYTLHTWEHNTACARAHAHVINKVWNTSTFTVCMCVSVCVWDLLSSWDRFLLHGRRCGDTPEEAAQQEGVIKQLIYFFFTSNKSTPGCDRGGTRKKVNQENAEVRTCGMFFLFSSSTLCSDLLSSLSSSIFTSPTSFTPSIILRETEGKHADDMEGGLMGRTQHQESSSDKTSHGRRAGIKPTVLSWKS